MELMTSESSDAVLRNRKSRQSINQHTMKMTKVVRTLSRWLVIIGFIVANLILNFDFY